MNEAELRILLSLLMKMGMRGSDSLFLIRQHGVTEGQIAAAGLEQELRTREEIQKLKKN